ncbi:MAG: hypothetical protein IPQ07_45710 [Myxococcales bacterium]|nr:hypothetical protein [Myxococcales bacterium]
MPIREVVLPPQGEKGLADGVCFVGDGTAVNSGPIDGLASPQAKAKALALLETRGVGKAKVTYKLRDWLFSRQRYWGEPVSALHEDATAQTSLVDDAELPIALPEIDDFKPSRDGAARSRARRSGCPTTAASPPGAIPPQCRRAARAGTGASWIRTAATAAWDAAEQYWMPVDLYVGGVEHAVLHLLYARFWHKVLHFDDGLVSTKEPFQRLYHQGSDPKSPAQDPTTTKIRSGRGRGARGQGSLIPSTSNLAACVSHLVRQGHRHRKPSPSR